MAALQISNLRVCRELDSEKQARLSAEANLEDHMDRVRNLEDLLCSAQIELDDKQLEWENRQEDMETIIKQLEDEREQIFRATSLADDEELIVLRQKYTLLKETHKIHLENSQSEIHDLRNELSMRNAANHEVESRIEALKRDLHSNEQELAIAAEAADEVIKNRGLQDHITKLNREMVKRDAKIREMKRAIGDLKEALIKSVEDSAERRIRESSENLSANAEDRGLGNVKKIAQLQAKIERLTKANDIHKRCEKDLKETALKLNFDLDKREKHIENLQEQLVAFQKQMRKLQFAQSKREKNQNRSRSESFHPRDGENDEDDPVDSSKDHRLAKLLDEERRNAAASTKERWDAEKKMQKRIDNIKSKLDEKSEKLSLLLNREKTLKDSLARFQLENAKLTKRLSALGSIPSIAVAALEAQHQHHTNKKQLQQHQRNSEASATTENSSYFTRESSSTDPSRPSNTTDITDYAYFDPDDIDINSEESAVRKRLLKTLSQLDNAQMQIRQLESENDQWKRVAEVDRMREIKTLKRNIEKLNEKFEEKDSSNSSSDSEQGTNSINSSDGESSDTSSGKNFRSCSKSPEKSAENIKRGFNYSEKKGEKSKHLIPVLEARIEDLIQRLNVADDEKLELEQKLLEEKFEKEKLQTEGHRMERKISEVQEKLKVQAEIQAAKVARKALNEIPGLNISYTQLRTSTSRLLANKSKDDLAAVIDHLSAAAEKLKAENDQFKKGTSGTISSLKYMDMVKEIKSLKKDRVEAIEMAKAKAISDAQSSKVEEENNKLRAQNKRDSDKLKRLTQHMTELEVSNDELLKEVANLRKNATNTDDLDLHDLENVQQRIHDDAEMISQLKDKLEDKNKIIQTLSVHNNNDSEKSQIDEVRKLKRELEVWQAQSNQAKEQLEYYLKIEGNQSRANAQIEANIAEMHGGLGEVIYERNMLRDKVASLEYQIQKLKAELSNFDGTFMAELEELKNKYRETLKLNIKYEEHIRNLCSELGYSAQRILSQPFRRYNSDR
ncbi:hypothetical protein HK100_010734 [Physocladia obscura]|uniref:Uncharacterized protein n=1 Tax=Physocladia obscura TaxID=109957 RepID=A0AAD5T3F7_9FUNG|nr:hypothetical protein HK100_010734 [Physocladia obscura]